MDTWTHDDPRDIMYGDKKISHATHALIRLNNLITYLVYIYNNKCAHKDLCTVL